MKSALSAKRKRKWWRYGKLHDSRRNTASETRNRNGETDLIQIIIVNNVGEQEKYDSRDEDYIPEIESDEVWMRCIKMKQRNVN